MTLWKRNFAHWAIPAVAMMMCATWSSAPAQSQRAEGDSQEKNQQDADESQRSEWRDRFEDLPAAVRLGARVEGVRRKIPVAPVVVVVEDERSYIDAISRWSVDLRYPVLIDAGSDEARENIARFVRAFEPDEVLRYSAPAEKNGDAGAPASVDRRREAIVSAAASAWGAESYETLGRRWRDIGFAPPGVVVAWPTDPAWTGALALSAGRGQPIVWTRPPAGRLGGVMDAERLDAFDNAVRGALEQLEAPWRDRGDIIEAISLCMNAPSKVPLAERDGPAALTDRIGRHPDGERYAWCGLLHGGEAAAAYRAMSALFLQPKRAWLFDGYGEREQFADYAVQPAAESLSDRGLHVTADDPGGNGARAWRARARRGVDAGLILVNSSGRRRSFNVPGGSLSAGDVPPLRVPAAVHFIHSFSAQNLNDDRSIAPRWLASGAFVYVGAVHEPFLQAFQTPEALVTRLLAPAPIAAAARRGGAPLWRVNVLGDPLYTIGESAPRGDEAPDLPEARSLEIIMREALKQGDLERGLAALVMLGRDKDAERLARAAMNQDQKQFSPSMARIAFPSIVREGRRATIAKVYAALPREAARDPFNVDLLWLSLRGALRAGDERAIALLQDRVREDSYVDDALAVAEGMRRGRGARAARAAISAYASRAPSDKARQRLEQRLGDSQRQRGSR